MRAIPRHIARASRRRVTTLGVFFLGATVTSGLALVLACLFAPGLVPVALILLSISAAVTGLAWCCLDCQGP